jgi:nucleotide-binding universal stress UspA family protein
VSRHVAGDEGRAVNTQRETPSVKGAVVVGVDASRAAKRAVEWAADQAALEHRRLVLVHATGTLGTTGTTWLDSAPADSPVLVKMRGEGAAIVDPAAEQARELHPELIVDTYVPAEDAAPELRRLTADAHLVVVGTRGNNLLRHLPTWQVGARVAGKATSPVVVVPAYDTDVARLGVLVGVDLSERSGPVLRFAYELAALREQPLTIAHFARDRIEDAERLLAEAVAGLREEYPDVHVTRRVIEGSPTASLLRMANRMHLLVVGQHHKLGAHEFSIRHVHASIVDRSPCPVAVVPVEVGPGQERHAATAPDQTSLTT